MPNKILANWVFPEYATPERKRGWYVWAIIIFVFLLAYSILTANFLFGLIVIIVAIILIVHQQKQTLDIKFFISPRGISINDRFYEFKDLKNFWLVYEPPAIKNLYFKPKSNMRPTLIIPLQNENPVKIRKILKEYLDEDLDKENEGLTEALERVLKI